MYRKLGLLVLVLVFMFLFTGLAYGCSKYVCIKEPGNVNKVLNPGLVFNVIMTSGGTLPANANISKEKLEYKCLDDLGWTLITIRSCNPVSGCPLVYPWEVPFTPDTDCQMRVTILDGNGNRLAGDLSGMFAIGGGSLKLVQPDGGETLTSSQEYPIIWNSSIKDVDRSILYYRCEGMETWSRIITLQGNPLVQYSWTVPDIEGFNCKVKITLKDSLGTVLATDQSNGTFTIQPAP